jgi:hypothetical protein
VSDFRNESSLRLHVKREGTKGSSPVVKNSGEVAVFGPAAERDECGVWRSSSRHFEVRRE